MKKIKIKGYKSIKNLDLALRSINIIIGANGSGKSNFLSFFDFLKQIYNRNLQEYVALKGIDTFLHKGDKVTNEIDAFLGFNNTNAYSFTLKKGDTGLIFTEEGMWYDKNPYYENKVDIASYGHESKLRFQTMPRANYIRNYLDQLAKYHFHDTGENSPFSKESNIENDKFYLYEKGSNLAAFLYHIQQEHRIVYNLIVKNIQSIAPYFSDFFFRPESNGNLKLRWRDKYSSVVYGVNDLSDGTIRFIALTVLFMQPDLPETIVIDEPELGLHPTAIAKLAGLVKSVASKGCQVILATQSTDLISHFDPEDIVTVDLIDGESVFNRLNSETLEQWLEDYTIDDLWKRNIITTGQPNFS
ncbi:AAA family ATPase [Flavilitoribacter nigricans]|uniref:ATPase n=1 Tax=Flavilitoribacter nigricans (strain ATCC 23147 / DSM 23189 / NBRC 102662 / NCIMB 1420 / SS-2) TaxID=1122177 RepID=A0A2D0MZ28_FLAN2|nr:AAA family ATPase [Flavilitoribacter nigricans]PHN01139.1 ATPase [Flavilitoribacter nigricans DSM 23189 = NBRC 102662]